MPDIMERADLTHGPSDTCRDYREVILALEPAVGDSLELLMPIDRAWQPSDYLPDLEADDWREQVERFRRPAQAISDELLVVSSGAWSPKKPCPATR